MKRLRDILPFLASLLIVLLLTACHSYDDAPTEKAKTVLTIYVYPPGNPMVTRGDVGVVTSNEEEKKIHSLQIWIFVHNTGQKVAYLEVPQGALPDGTLSGKYEIDMPDWFTMSKPNVDVYVAANVTQSNCGQSIGGETTKEEIDGLTFTNNFFGLANPVNSVPADGLPMTGVLKNQPIVGDAPTLRVGSWDTPANVRLLRTTSRLRFVFGRPSDESTPTLTIKDISIASGCIPDVEYLMPDDVLPYHVGTYYNADPAVLFSESKNGSFVVDTSCPTPNEYVYNQSGAQDYENKIDQAIKEKKLSALPPYYLRESDRLVHGTIDFQVGNGERKTAEFYMENAGDFSRDHSWLVYAYYSDAATLEVITVNVKDWENVDTPEYPIFNW